MYRQRFRCFIQEPLVLFKKAKTEQSTEILEYIPGSLFRGYIANRLFEAKESDPMIDDLIFNGAVLYGDAHLIIQEQRSKPLPFSYHKFQTDVQSKYINLSKCAIPLEKHKQVKEGYFIDQNGNIISLKPLVNDRMKAARSLKDRASEEGAMYLYRYIDAEQSFEFEIKAETREQLKVITGYLTKKNIYLGKSKSAEFGGKATITPIDKPIEEKTSEATIAVNTLYAASNWCFLNAYGMYTSQLTGMVLCGQEDVEIDWEKSFLRFRTYAPFNAYRNAYDAQRLIIEKGSVVVFKKPVTVAHKFYEKGIGVYRTEGFGEVEWNCDFLEQDNFNISSIDNEIAARNIEFSHPLYLLLKERKEVKDQLNTDFKKAKEKFNANQKNFASIGSAQWGNVLHKISRYTDQEKILNCLFVDNHTKLDRSRHSKWKQKDLFNLTAIVKECENAQAFKIFVKSMINQNKDV